MLKIGKAERCNHRPCVCEGLGGYMKMTEVVQKQVGQRDSYTDDEGRIWTTRTPISIHEDVFSYSWLKAVKVR